MSVRSEAQTQPGNKLKKHADYKANNELVKACAHNRWVEILVAHGIPEHHLSGKHTSCVIHGGINGFRFKDEGRGAWVCATCTNGKFEDGFNLIARYSHNRSNKEAFRTVAKYLGLHGNSPSKNNNVKQPLTPNQEHINQEAMRLEQAQKLLTRKNDAGTHADKILSICELKPNPYLQGKGIDAPAFTLTKNYKVTQKQTVYAGALINSVYDIENHQQLIGSQFINADGSRAYVTGTPISEGIHIIQGDESSPYVGLVEGKATGESVSLSVGIPVIVAFDANGMKSKAKQVANSFPGKIILCLGDNDSHKHSTGNKAAEEAATITNGIAVIPPEAGDWNDYHQAHGLNATKAEIERQLKAQSITKDSEMSTIDVDIAEESIDEETNLLFGMPQKPSRGFILEKNALVFYKEMSDGSTKAIPVSSRIEVIAKQSDLYTGGNVGLTLEFITLFGKKKTWSMPRSSLADDKTIMASLCGLGASIHDKRLFNSYLMNANPKNELFCVERIGWHIFNEKHYFVLPDSTKGNHEDKNKLVYQDDELNTLFSTKGTIKEWRDHIGKYCIGNSRLIFAVSHAFASMILEPTGSTNGGINLFGPSSTGKTTIARICGSIFSSINYVESCRTTTNALENTAHSHNDCVLILDEIAQFNEKEMGDAVYTLCNGMGKGRMKSETDARKIKKFRNNFILTGEISVSQHINEGGKRDTEGQGIRILDIPAVVGEYGVFECLLDFKSGAEFSKYLVEQCNKYYGTSFLEFIERLTKSDLIDSLRDKLKATKNKLIAELPEELRTMEGQADRALDRFALAALAGQLATEWGITGWNIGDSIKAACECFKAWLNQRGGVKNQESIKLLKQVKAFFAVNGESRFTDIDNQENSKTLNRVGFRKLINDEWVYYVIPAALNELHKGFTKEFAVKTLIESGWIETRKDSNGWIESCVQKKIPKQGNKRVYIFNSMVWD